MDTTTSDIKSEINLFLESFELENEEERKYAGKIINYVIRQLNNESLKGVVEFSQYKNFVLSSVKGLFKLIYLDFLDCKNNDERMHRLIRADVVYTSAMNFMLMLFTRVLGGKDRELIIKQIESVKPMLVSDK